MLHILHPNYPITADEFNYRYWTLEQSLSQITDNIGGWSSELRRHALNAGLVIRTPHQATELRIRNGMGRKYHIKQNFFDSWSAPMAWVLGLIASDGCIVQEGHWWNITLVDDDCLRQVAALFEYDGPLIKAPHSNCQILKINNTYMVRQLLKIGLTPRKSLTLKYPQMPSDMHRHFIRGYFDGDGSISIVKSRSPNSQLCFCRTHFCTSSKDFVDRLQEILEQEGIITTLLVKTCANQKPSKRIKQTADHYNLHVSTGSANTLIEYLYDGVPENLCLQRKRRKLKQWYAQHSHAYKNGRARMGPLPKPRKPCSIPNCDQPCKSRGMCESHYHKWWYKHRKKRT